MIRLSEYIKENINDILNDPDFIKLHQDKKDLIQYLLTTDKIRNNDIKRALHVTSNFDDSIYDDIKTILDSNERAAFTYTLETNQIKRQFIRLYSKLYNGEHEKLSYEKVLSKTGNHNIYELIANIFSKDKDINLDDLKNILHILCNISTKDENNKGIGKGEILFKLFIKDISKKGEGDINIKNGTSIELKTHSSSPKKDNSIKLENGGRIIGNNNRVKDPKCIMDELKKLLSQYFEDPNEVNFLNNISSKKNKNGYNLSTTDGMKKICDYIAINSTKLKNKYEDNIIGIYKEIFIVFCKAIYVQFFDDIESNTIFEKFINKLSNSIVDNGKNVGELLMNIHATLSIISYKLNGWNYLVVLNSKSGNYDFISDADNIDIDNISNLYKTFTTKFIFQNGPSVSPGSSKQNYVCTIYLNEKQ